jgi:hypothetical protein
LKKLTDDERKKTPGSLLCIGKIYQEKREIDRAIEHFELYEVNSSYTETYDLMINAYYDLQGRCQESLLMRN